MAARPAARPGTGARRRSRTGSSSTAWASTDGADRRQGRARPAGVVGPVGEPYLPTPRSKTLRQTMALRFPPQDHDIGARSGCTTRARRQRRTEPHGRRGTQRRSSTRSTKRIASIELEWPAGRRCRAIPRRSSRSTSFSDRRAACRPPRASANGSRRTGSTPTGRSAPRATCCSADRRAAARRPEPPSRSDGETELDAAAPARRGAGHRRRSPSRGRRAPERPTPARG